MRFMTKGSTMQRHARRRSVLGSRKQKLTHACRRVLIDQLESRVLLSTGGTPDPGFGQGGYLRGYQVLAVYQDGSLIASKDSASGSSSLVLLHPDGSFESAYTGPAPTPPQYNYSPEGFLRINGNSLTSGNALSCYDGSGNVVLSFGNNGTVTDFTSGTGYPAGAFNPETVTVVGNQILVGGQLTLDTSQDYADALVCLNPDGSINHAFGSNGIAVGAKGMYIATASEILVGPNGNYYLAGSLNGKPVLTDFAPTGAYIASAQIQSTGQGAVYGLEFSRNNVYLLAAWTNTSQALVAYDLNLNPDTGFGNNGIVVVIPPDHSPTAPISWFSAGPMIVDPDGRIFVSGYFDYPDGSGGDYAIAYLPDWGANTSVSGFIYNDVKTDGKMDSGDTPMRYWQAFVDLNGNGTYDAGEPTAYADYNGYYKIHALDAGTYNVYEVMPDIWKLTEPSSTAYHTFTVGSGQVSTGNDFGNYLYGTPGADPSFGENGEVVGYTAQQVLPNGIIVAKDSSGKLVGLNPDGSVDPTFNPVTDIPPAPLPGVYQPDGKRLVLDTSTGTITRYNTDGTIDKTFGNNGSVTSYIQVPTRYLGEYIDPSQIPFHDTTFTPQYIALQGNDIIVSGLINGERVSGFAWPQLGFQRLHSDGSEDNTFGLVNYNVTGDVIDAVWEGLFVGNDGQIYTAETSGDVDVDLLTMSPDGTSANLEMIRGNAVLLGFEVDPSGGTVFVTDSANGHSYEVNGYPVIVAPNQQYDSTNVVSWPLILPDGEVLFNVTYSQNGAQRVQTFDLLIRYGGSVGSTPQPGSISGTFFYDSNTNGVWDSGEAPSPYWGVYIDANNDGKYDTGDTELIANGAGQYTFNNLAPGTYIVRGTTASGWTQTFPANGGAQTVTVGSGQAVTGINFGEFHGIVSTAKGSISGTFFYDSNTNGAWDSGEAPSPYWGVYIDANNDGTYDSGDTELIANGAGQFTFNNLAPGTYIVRGTTASGWTQTFPANG
ncbi:MAG TPA: SdrD B-like domain-containing protein, partial [Tepidisphaeraceae bacterium]|nr:SdrD B-like domain-containing protein [Tepidisphaeraceae bacterium]